MTGHRKGCFCQNCGSHRRVVFCLWVVIASLVSFLLCKFKPQAAELPARLNKRQVMIDSEIRDWRKDLATKCPACKLYVTVGAMADGKAGKVPSAIFIVKDAGTELRVWRFQTVTKINCIVLALPTMVVDAEFIKFMKGSNNE